MNIFSRRKTRKFLYQFLFSRSYNDNSSQDFIDSFYSWDFEWSLDLDYFEEMLSIIYGHEENFLYLINKFAPKFDIKSMKLDSILAIYISLAELSYLKEEIPIKISLNEAIEIAKVFWDDSSKKMVNWILNSFSKNIEENIKDLWKNKFDYVFLKK